MTINFAQGIQTNHLTGLGVIRVTGADARVFLHSQLTQDITGLLPSESKLAGYCSAKGRLYAVLQVFADEQAVYLITRRSLIAPLIKRLSMFVLRAKVVFDDASDELSVYGICSKTVLTVGLCQSDDDGHRLGVLPFVHDGQIHARELRVTRVAPKTDLLEVSEAVWDWLDVQAGMPRIDVATYEAFVPQMVNLDRIGGVNFKKGCYPGQEVVARSHYLGKLKRRMQKAQLHFASASAAHESLPQLVAGVDVYSSIDASQPAGKMVVAALNPFNPLFVDVLFEVSLPFLADGAQLSVEDVLAVWQEMPLPYALAD